MMLRHYSGYTTRKTIASMRSDISSIRYRDQSFRASISVWVHLKAARREATASTLRHVTPLP